MRSVQGCNEPVTMDHTWILLQSLTICLNLPWCPHRVLGQGSQQEMQSLSLTWCMVLVFMRACSMRSCGCMCRRKRENGELELARGRGSVHSSRGREGGGHESAHMCTCARDQTVCNLTQQRHHSKSLVLQTQKSELCFFLKHSE